MALFSFDFGTSIALLFCDLKRELQSEAVRTQAPIATPDRGRGSVRTSSYKSPEWKPCQVWGIMCITVVLTVSFLLLAHQGIGKCDSTMFRIGATLCGPQLYQCDLQRKLLGTHYTPYFRAPFYAWLLQPLLNLDFALALFVLNVAAATLVILLMPRSLGKYPYGLSPLVVLFMPLAHNFSIEQDGALVLLVLSLSLIAENSGFQFLAGAILALTLEKPSLFVLLPLVIAIQKKFRMLCGYLTCASVLVILSLSIVGTSAIRDYIDLVIQYKVVPEKMPTARGIAANFHAFPLWPALTAMAVALIVWRTRRTSFKGAFCIGIVGSLFLSPQSYPHDSAILLLPVLYFLYNGSVLQRAVSALWLVPPLPLAFALPPPWASVPAFLVALLLAVLTLTQESGASRSVTTAHHNTKTYQVPGTEPRDCTSDGNFIKCGSGKP